MKKSAKIVILFLSVALVFGALALIAGASGNVVVDYTTENGIETTDSIETALENVVEGGTVTLKSKISVRDSIKISKSVTVNLNGNTIVSNANVPVFAIDAAEGSAISVRITGSGYIESEMGILDQSADAEVSFIGETYGMHINVRNDGATALSVSAGKVYLENVRLVMSNRAPVASFVKVSGGELSGKNFGIVSAAEEGSYAYAVELSDDGVVNLDNCYIDTTTSVFYVADGTSGAQPVVPVEPEVEETTDEVIPDEPTDEVPPSEDSDAMPEATLREELVAFKDADANPIINVTDSHLVQRIVGSKQYATSFITVKDALENGVSGAMKFTGSSLVFMNGFINTGFGVETEDEALYKDFVMIFDNCDIDGANYGNLAKGYLFRARATAKFINGCTIDIGTAAFANATANTISGGESLIYMEEGTRINVEVPKIDITPAAPEGEEEVEIEPVYAMAFGAYSGYDFVYDPFGVADTPYVLMDAYTRQVEVPVETTTDETTPDGEAPAPVYVTEYRSEAYKEICEYLANLSESVVVDMETYLRGNYSFSENPSGFGYSTANRGGGQIYIEFNDETAYYAYHVPEPGDSYTTHVNSGVANDYIFDEDNGTFQYTTRGGFISMNNSSTYPNAITDPEKALVIVREMDFAPAEAGMIELSFSIMSYSSASYGHTMTVESEATVGGKSIYSDGRWNKLYIVTKVTVNESNSSKIDINTTFIVNPGTDVEYVTSGSQSNRDYLNGELRVGVALNDAAPFDAGVLFSDFRFSTFQNVDPETFNARDYIRRGEGLLSTETRVNNNIRVNGIAFPDLEKALAYAEEHNTFVTVSGDVKVSQSINSDSADGYIVVTGDYSVPFDSEKAAKFYGEPAGAGTAAFFFSEDIYGAGKPVSTNWYVGNAENIIDDMGNVATSSALVGTYPKAPKVDVAPVIIGGRYYTFKGWTTDAYLWYGDFATAEEYEAAVAELSIGIKTISYSDLVFGVGPTYYPVYKDSGLPSYIVTNPAKLAIGSIHDSEFASYVANLGANDTLSFSANVTASIPSSIYIEGADGETAYVYIDVAGNTFDISSVGSFIKLGSDVELRIYSSLPGGKIVYSGASANDYFVEITSGAENANVYIDGANLEISASGIALNSGAASSTVYVNGGIYNRFAASCAGLFACKNGEGKIEVTGATLLASAASSTMFYSELANPRSSFGESDFIVDDCMIVAASSSDTVMNLAQYSSLYISNSVITGRLGNSTNKVIVGNNVSYMRLSGANAIVGIAAYSEANLANGVRSDLAIVYGAEGLATVSRKSAPDMFENPTGNYYIVTNKSGSKVCFYVEGSVIPEVEADSFVAIPRISYVVIDNSVETVTVKWLGLDENVDNPLLTEKYTLGANYVYTGMAPSPLAINSMVSKVYNGEWEMSAELSTDEVIVMVPKFNLSSSISGLYSEMDFTEGLSVNLYIPYELYATLGIETRSSLNHATRIIADGDYYYISGLTAEADQALIDALLDAGFVCDESTGDYILSAALYMSVSDEYRALLTPIITNNNGEFVSLTTGVTTNMAVSGANVTIIVEIDDVVVEHIETVSVTDYLKASVEEELAKAEPDIETLKLLAYVVNYLDKSYAYYDMFYEVDVPGFDFSSIMNVEDYIAEGDYLEPDHEGCDYLEISANIDISVDFSADPKFVIVAKDPDFAGVIYINDIGYTIASADVVKGRYTYTYKPASINKLSEILNITIDVSGDGSNVVVGQYCLYDFINADVRRPSEMRELLEALKSYVCYARIYAGDDVLPEPTPEENA